MEFKYSLYGVLVHAGWNTQSGHYYCFVRTSSGIWHNLDDNEVILFYVVMNLFLLFIIDTTLFYINASHILVLCHIAFLKLLFFFLPPSTMSCPV